VLEPYLATVVIGGGFLRHGGSAEQKAQHIPGIIDGSKTFAFAQLEKNSRYDLSDVALGRAAHNLTVLGCPIELRRGDLLEGVRTSGETFDVIFSSFALHHLSSAQKTEFFQSARERLNESGIVIVIDTMRDVGEERASYLDHYCAWLRSRCMTLSPEALDFLCEHIRNNDFPETIIDFGAMATKAGFCQPIEINRFRWHHTWYFNKR